MMAIGLIDELIEIPVISVKYSTRANWILHVPLFSIKFPVLLNSVVSIPGVTVIVIFIISRCLMAGSRMALKGLISVILTRITMLIPC